MENNEYETLRWPTNLDRAGIEKRLIQVRESGVPELATRFTDVEKMTPAQLGSARGLFQLSANAGRRDRRFPVHPGE